MSLDNARKLALIEAWFPRIVHPLIRPFAGLERTRNYVRMATGSISHHSARLLKAVPTAATTWLGATTAPCGTVPVIGQRRPRIRGR